jgi:hypothetical protein
VRWAARRLRRSAPAELERSLYLDTDLLRHLAGPGGREVDDPLALGVRARDDLEARGVLVDLDRDPRAQLVPGRAVTLSGVLRHHPATAAAELLELSTPLLTHGAPRPAAGPNAGPDRAPDASSDATDVPLVVSLPHPSGEHLLVLPATGRTADPDALIGTRITVLAVVDRVLSRRDRLAVDDYLRPHLSERGARALGDRPIDAVIGPLSEVSRSDIDGVTFRGPGLLLTPAAIAS